MGLFSRLPAGAKAVKPRLYAAIDRATSEYLSAPNLGQNMDVVSTINSAIDPRYASNKACKRIALRIGTRNQRVQYISLLLLENLVRSCGETFHSELAKSPLLAELSRMGDRSVWCATEIQRLVLALVQEWAYEVQFPQFSAVYSKLKQRGMPFEPRGTLPTALLQPYPGLPPADPSTLQPQNIPAGATNGAHPQQPPQRPPSRGAANLGPDLLRPGKPPAQLKADIDAARGTIVLLNEVLSGIESDGSWQTVKEEYCVEVASACQAIKDRLAALLGSTDATGTGDESMIAAALEVNDDAQRALDRRSLFIDVADGRRAAPTSTASVGLATTVAGVSSGATGDDHEDGMKKEGNGKGETSGKGDDMGFDAAEGAPAPTAPDSAPPLLDLLSDLDWAPAPAANGTSGEEAHKVTDPVSGSGVAAAADPFLPPPPMIPPPSNNPFAAAPLSPAMAWNHVQEQEEGQRQLGQIIDGLSPKSNNPSETEKEEKSNPFLSDDAFKATASTSSVPPQQQHAVVTTPSGNPFAALDAPPSVLAPPFPGQHVALPSAGADHSSLQQRPPALVVPSAAGSMPVDHYAHLQQQQQLMYSPGPFTAPPAYHHDASTAATTPQFPFAFAQAVPPQHPQHVALSGTQQQYPMTTTGAMQYQHQQSGAGFGGPGLMTPQYGGQAVYTPSGGEFRPSTTFPGPYGTNVAGGGVNKMSDAFGDLVRLAPEREQAPPPPKGVPMRQSSVASSSASVQQRSPSAASASAGQTTGATSSSAPASDAVSAFDAFDMLANGR